MIVKKLGQLANWTEALDYAERLRGEVEVIHTLATVSIKEFTANRYVAAPIEMYAQDWNTTRETMDALYGNVEAIYAFQSIVHMPSEGDNMYSFCLVLVYVREGEQTPEPEDTRRIFSVEIRAGTPAKDFDKFAVHVKKFDLSSYPGAQLHVLLVSKRIFIHYPAMSTEIVQFAIAFDDHITRHGIPNYAPDSTMRPPSLAIANALNHPWPMVS